MNGIKAAPAVQDWAGWATGSMSAKLQRNFADLPSVVIVEIYKYLSFKDKLRASSTCQTWRECLFHPLFWTKVHIRLNRKNYNWWRKADFLGKRCGRFVRYAIVDFECSNSVIVRKCMEILNILSENRQLVSLTLRPTACSVKWPYCEPSKPNVNETTTVYEKFLDAIKKIIRTSSNLKHLSLGCLEDVLNHSDHLLTLLSKHQQKSLQQLHLSSVKEDPDHYPILEIRNHHFEALVNLKILSIDYDYICDQLLLQLASPKRKPLKQLHINVHGLEQDQPSVCNSSWLELKRHSEGLEVSITLLHTSESEEALASIFLTDIPLVHFRSFYSDGFYGDLLNLLSLNYAETLRSVFVVNQLTEFEIPLRTFLIMRESPLVMLAWRCHRLSSLKFVGHEITDTDLIAIARLRGPELKELIIPLDCLSSQFSESGTTVFYNDLSTMELGLLEHEVSTSLHRSWTFATGTYTLSPMTEEKGNTRSYLKVLQQSQLYQEET